MLLVIYSNPHLNSKDEKQEAIVCVVTYCDHTHNLQVLWLWLNGHAEF